MMVVFTYMIKQLNSNNGLRNQVNLQNNEVRLGLHADLLIRKV